MNHLKDLGIKKAINKTRLKVRLLEHFPEALEQFDDRNTVIVFKKGMENMMKEALKKCDFSEDAMTLAKAATIVRNDIFNHQAFKFAGCFPPECQKDSLSSSVKSFIPLIFSAPYLKDQDKRESQTCLTIGQFIF